MYKIWQKKHFPLHGFDEALDQIADIGKTNQLKAPPQFRNLPAFRQETCVLLAYKAPHHALSAQRSSVMQRLQYTRTSCRCIQSRSSFVQMEMREMRQGALKVMQKSKEDSQQQQQVQDVCP